MEEHPINKVFNFEFITNQELMDTRFREEDWSIIFSYKGICLEFVMLQYLRSERPTDPMTFFSNYIADSVLPKAKKMAERTTPPNVGAFEKMLMKPKHTKTPAMMKGEFEMLICLILTGNIDVDMTKFLVLSRPPKKHTEPEKLEECCVCLEDKKISWRCNTCKAGLVCNGCRKKTKHSCVGCPVCRSV